jgi:hypothetical protein
VKDVTAANFGLLIAYVLPGFVLLWGLEPYSETVQTWMGQSSSANAGVGGFLYITVASVGVGQVVSTIRWLMIDRIHHATGIERPNWNFARLSGTVDAFDRLIEDHYRYYQFHANGLIAVTTAAFLIWWAHGFRWTALLMVIAVDAVLFAGSRDTLRKYYRRVEEVLRR